MKWERQFWVRSTVTEQLGIFIIEVVDDVHTKVQKKLLMMKGFPLLTLSWMCGPRIAPPPQVYFSSARWRALGALSTSGHGHAGHHSQGLRDETLQTLIRLLSTKRHLRRHHSLPLDYQYAFLAGTVLEATVALVSLEPREHAVVPAASALGRPLEGRAGLRHRAPHVEVGWSVAIHFPRVTEARSFPRSSSGASASDKVQGQRCQQHRDQAPLLLATLVIRGVDFDSEMRIHLFPWQ